MECKEYQSFYKTVGGNEGTKCKYPTRLDTYGCGCQHDCSYCYAKSLLDFRGLWDAKNPAVADINKIRRKIKTIPKGSIIRLGGMTDCFQAIEREKRVTYNTIKALNDAGIGYLIVTKSDMIAEPEYLEILDKRLAHIQITVTCFDDEKYLKLNYEKAPLPSMRVKAIELLNKMGLDVQLRLSPFIPQLADFGHLNAIKCDKLLIEFLRVNSWIKKWFDIDFSDYTVRQDGYYHMPLEKKLLLLENIHGFKSVTICEDETRAYQYWKQHVNPNKDDCCNLRGADDD